MSEDGSEGSATPPRPQRRIKKVMVLSSASESDSDDSDGPTLTRKRRLRVVSEDEGASSSGSSVGARRRRALPQLRDSDADSDESGPAAGCGPPAPSAPPKPSSGFASDSSEGNSDKCSICLMRFTEQEVGTPVNCEHIFCLDCITEWSKNVNTCPVDRITFDSIVVRTCAGGRVLRSDPVQVMERRPSVEMLVIEDPTSCVICGSTENEESMLLCDGCDLGFHMQCLSPPIVEIPIDQWYCPGCISRGLHNIGSLEDIIYLSEVDDLFTGITDMELPRGPRPAPLRQPRDVRRSSRNQANDEPSTSSGRRGASTDAPTTSRGVRTRAPRAPPRRRRKPTRRRTKTVIIEYEVEENGKFPITRRVKKTVRKRKIRKRRPRTAARRTLVRASVRAQLAALAAPAHAQAGGGGGGGGATLHERRARAGIPALSLFGSDRDLEYFSDDAGTGAEAASEGASTAVARATRPGASVFSAYRQARRKMVSVPSPPHATAAPDLLSNILESQTLLHSRRSVVSVTVDGQISIKLQGEGRVDVSKGAGPLRAAPAHGGRGGWGGGYQGNYHRDQSANNFGRGSVPTNQPHHKYRTDGVACPGVQGAGPLRAAPAHGGRGGWGGGYQGNYHRDQSANNFGRGSVPTNQPHHKYRTDGVACPGVQGAGPLRAAPAHGGRGGWGGGYQGNYHRDQSANNFGRGSVPTNQPHHKYRTDGVACPGVQGAGPLRAAPAHGGRGGWGGGYQGNYHRDQSANNFGRGSVPTNQPHHKYRTDGVACPGVQGAGPLRAAPAHGGRGGWGGGYQGNYHRDQSANNFGRGSVPTNQPHHKYRTDGVACPGVQGAGPLRAAPAHGGRGGWGGGYQGNYHRDQSANNFGRGSVPTNQPHHKYRTDGVACPGVQGAGPLRAAPAHGGRGGWGGGYQGNYHRDQSANNFGRGSVPTNQPHHKYRTDGVACPGVQGAGPLRAAPAHGGRGGWGGGYQGNYHRDQSANNFGRGSVPTNQPHHKYRTDGVACPGVQGAGPLRAAPAHGGRGGWGGGYQGNYHRDQSANNFGRGSVPTNQPHHKYRTDGVACPGVQGAGPLRAAPAHGGRGGWGGGYQGNYHRDQSANNFGRGSVPTNQPHHKYRTDGVACPGVQGAGPLRAAPAHGGRGGWGGGYQGNYHRDQSANNFGRGSVPTNQPHHKYRTDGVACPGVQGAGPLRAAPAHGGRGGWGGGYQGNYHRDQSANNFGRGSVPTNQPHHKYRTDGVACPGVQGAGPLRAAPAHGGRGGWGGGYQGNYHRDQSANNFGRGSVPTNQPHHKYRTDGVACPGVQGAGPLRAAPAHGGRGGWGGGYQGNYHRDQSANNFGRGSVPTNQPHHKYRTDGVACPGVQGAGPLRAAPAHGGRGGWGGGYQGNYHRDQSANNFGRGSVPTNQPHHKYRTDGVACPGVQGAGPLRAAPAHGGRGGWGGGYQGNYHRDQSANNFGRGSVPTNQPHHKYRTDGVACPGVQGAGPLRAAPAHGGRGGWGGGYQGNYHRDQSANNFGRGSVPTNQPHHKYRTDGVACPGVQGAGPLRAAPAHGGRGGWGGGYQGNYHRDQSANNFGRGSVPTNQPHHKYRTDGVACPGVQGAGPLRAAPAHGGRGGWGGGYQGNYHRDQSANNFGRGYEYGPNGGEGNYPARSNSNNNYNAGGGQRDDEAWSAQPRRGPACARARRPEPPRARPPPPRSDSRHSLGPGWPRARFEPPGRHSFGGFDNPLDMRVSAPAPGPAQERPFRPLPEPPQFAFDKLPEDKSEDGSDSSLVIDTEKYDPTEPTNDDEDEPPSAPVFGPLPAPPAPPLLATPPAASPPAATPPAATPPAPQLPAGLLDTAVRQVLQEHRALMESASAHSDEDSDGDCPNFSIYSATSVHIASAGSLAPPTARALPSLDMTDLVQEDDEPLSKTPEPPTPNKKVDEYKEKVSKRCPITPNTRDPIKIKLNTPSLIKRVSLYDDEDVAEQPEEASAEPEAPEAPEPTAEETKTSEDPPEPEDDKDKEDDIPIDENKDEEENEEKEEEEKKSDDEENDEEAKCTTPSPKEDKTPERETPIEETEVDEEKQNGLASPHSERSRHSELSQHSQHSPRSTHSPRSDDGSEQELAAIADAEAADGAPEKMTESISETEDERSYTPCLDENQSKDDLRLEGEALGTELISEDEANGVFSDAGSPAPLEPDGKKKKRKESKKDGKTKTKGKKDVAFRKLSKAGRERTYRDKDRRRRSGSGSPRRAASERRRREKRKDLERYDVRSVVTEKRKKLKDPFGRDVSPARSASHSPRVERSSVSRPRRSASRPRRSISRPRRSGSRVRRSLSHVRRSLSRPRRSLSRPKRSPSRGRLTPSPRIRRASPRSLTPLSPRRSASPRRARKRRPSPSPPRRAARREPAPRPARKRRRERERSRSASPKPKLGKKKKRVREPVAAGAARRREEPHPPRRKSPKRKKKRRSPSRSPSPPGAPAGWSPLSVDSRLLSPRTPPPDASPPPPPRRLGKRKRKEPRPDRLKHKRGKDLHQHQHQPAPSKEVFTSGDNILVSVSFAEQQKTALPAERRKHREARREKRKRRRLVPPTETEAAKPVAIIDLERSPFRELTPSPKNVIVLSDSDHGEKEPAVPAAAEPAPAAAAFASGAVGPKTPPEPTAQPAVAPVKFSLAAKPGAAPRAPNPLREEEEPALAEAENGPNTPPEPPDSPDAYDPFEPTRSASASPARAASPAPAQASPDRPSMTLEAAQRTNLSADDVIARRPLSPIEKVMALLQSTRDVSPEPVPLPTHAHAPPAPPAPAAPPAAPAPPPTPTPTPAPRVLLPEPSRTQPKLFLAKPSPIKSNPIKPMQATKISMLPLPARHEGGESPYSPGSSDFGDLFSPPPAGKRDAFDNLFGARPIRRKAKSHAAKVPVKFNRKKGKTQVGVKLDDDNLKILDELPSSAVEMQVKSKFLKKLNRQERVVEEVKHVLKPHYTRKRVSKEEYKDILRRAVPKICHNKTGEINPAKIQALVEAYVKKSRKKHKLGLA